VSDRQIDVFFYGLFMDEDVLRQAGAMPLNARRARVADYTLRIGQRATLVPEQGARAYGMLIALTHGELDRLYGAPGLEGYRPEAVIAYTFEEQAVPSLCYNLVQEPSPEERNPDYAARLKSVLEQLGFAADYVESIHRRNS
jgi:hypothetical protein